MADNLPETNNPEQGQQTPDSDSSGIVSSTAEASEQRAEEEKKKKEEEKEKAEEEQQATSEEIGGEEMRQQQTAIQMRQTYNQRQKLFQQKVKPLEDEIKELSRALFTLKISKIFSKFMDVGNFFSRWIAFTISLWWTIIVFIIDFLVILPGIIIFVFLGILKGPATKKIEKITKTVEGQVAEKQAQIIKERQNLGLNQLEAQM